MKRWHPFLALLLPGCLLTPDEFEAERARFQDGDGDGFTETDGDCGPDDPSRFPGAVELCDGQDNDCDGQIDEEPPDRVWFADVDGDGHGEATAPVYACTAPVQHVADGDDCDDADASIHPNAMERCNDKDDNCNGTVDEGAPADRTWYPDADRDGHGNPDAALAQCLAPGDGYVALGDDCDDADPAVSPSTPELCNGLDDDCDHLTDEEPTVDPRQWTLDLDGDGYGDDATALEQCRRPSGPYVLDGGDCDDGNADRYPGAAEYCNGVDDDCDTLVDDPPTTGDGAWYVDADLDGYGDENSAETTCDPSPGRIEQGGDCDDADNSVNPSASEVCNDGNDNNCDGSPNACVWPAAADLPDYPTFFGAYEDDMFGEEVGVADLDGDGQSEAIVLATYVYNELSENRTGLLYGLGAAAMASESLSDATYVFESDLASQRMLRNDFATGDIDGDGYDDLLIPTIDLSLSLEEAIGTATFIYGPITSSNLPALADWELDGPPGTGSFGSTVAVLPDMTGDGVADLLVGSIYTTETTVEQGSAYIVSGTSTGTLDRSTDTEAEFLGDDESRFYLATDGVGLDMDGDGFAELALGAGNAHGGTGGVGLFYGRTRGTYTYSDADVHLEGEGPHYFTGSQVDTLDDISGDGLPDLLIAGAADEVTYVVFGSTTLATISLADADVKIRADAGGSTGDSARNIGDLDGDGWANFAAGSRGDDCEVSIYDGPLTAGTILGASSDAEAVFHCDGVDDDFIRDIAAGDVDGDGITDLVVGAPWAGTDLEGTAYIVPGIGY